MEKIIDKHLIPDIRSIVISYVDEYKQQYEFVLWQLRIYHRDSLIFVRGIKYLNDLSYFKYFYTAIGSHKRRGESPHWTQVERDDLFYDIHLCRKH